MMTRAIENMSMAASGLLIRVKVPITIFVESPVRR